MESYCFEYDSLGRLIRSREEGGSGTVQRTEHLYDTANRLTNQAWTVGKRSFRETYAYDDSDGTMSSMKLFYSGGDNVVIQNTLAYSYDDLKRLSQASVTMTDLQTQNTTALYTRHYSYLGYVGDSNRTTSQLGTFVVRNASSAVIAGNRYEYDANGNITKIYEVFTSGNSTSERLLTQYSYDALDQLATETRYTYSGTSTTPAATTTVTYVIDTAGNLRSVTGGEHSVSYVYGDGNWADKLTGITVDNVSRTISYADAANPSNWFNGTDYTNITWTQGRRLTELTKGTDTYSYEYDMSGVRTVKIADGKKHEYVTQNGRVVRELVTNVSNGAFFRCMDFIYDENGKPYALRQYWDASLTNYDTFRYVLNAQGDVIQLTYQGGTVYAQYSYDAWGNVLTATGSLADANPLRYRGYYYDTETGFYYLQSRYYDPIVKRFLNADSYGSTGQGFLGFNMFAYCDNCPVLFYDDDGSIPFWVVVFRKGLARGLAHRLVQEHIRDNYDNIHIEVWVDRGHYHGGRVDIYRDGFIWEVKSRGSSHLAPVQLVSYLGCYLSDSKEKEKVIGFGSMHAFSGTIPIQISGCDYVIFYHTPCSGVVVYWVEEIQKIEQDEFVPVPSFSSKEAHTPVLVIPILVPIGPCPGFGFSGIPRGNYGPQTRPICYAD